MPDQRGRSPERPLTQSVHRSRRTLQRPNHPSEEGIREILPQRWLDVVVPGYHRLHYAGGALRELRSRRAACCGGSDSAGAGLCGESPRRERGDDRPNKTDSAPEDASRSLTEADLGDGPRTVGGNEVLRDLPGDVPYACGYESPKEGPVGVVFRQSLDTVETLLPGSRVLLHVLKVPFGFNVENGNRCGPTIQESGSPLGMRPDPACCGELLRELLVQGIRELPSHRLLPGIVGLRIGRGETRIGVEVQLEQFGAFLRLLQCGQLGELRAGNTVAYSSHFRRTRG